MDIVWDLVGHPSFDMVSRPFELRGHPSVDAQVSIPYTVAAAFLDGYVFLDSFEPEKVKERERNPLSKRAAVLRDGAIKDPQSLRTGDGGDQNEVGPDIL